MSVEKIEEENLREINFFEVKVKNEIEIKEEILDLNEAYSSHKSGTERLTQDLPVKKEIGNLDEKMLLCEHTANFSKGGGSSSGSHQEPKCMENEKTETISTYHSCKCNISATCLDSKAVCGKKKPSGAEYRKRRAEKELSIAKAMYGKKKPSGAEYRKRRAEKELSIAKDKGNLTKFFTRSTEAEASTSQTAINLNIVLNDDGNSPKRLAVECEKAIENVSSENASDESSDASHWNSTRQTTIDYSDIAKWPENTQSITDLLVRIGPVQVIDHEFPITIQAGRNRKFNATNYYRTLPNGEKYKRNWLVYSKSKDAVFCFCCKLFSKKLITLNHDGVNEWKNVNNRLKAHETSAEHLSCFRTWNDFIKRLNSTIDSIQQKQIDENTKHWRNVLERLFSLIKLHGSQNIALRGNSDQLYEDDNGNFLKIVELFAMFDPVMKEHVRRITNNEIYQHYLGKNIQNEMIQILSKAVKEKIGKQLKASKYYSLIVDCTPDLSHTEQMTLVVRFVSIVPTPDKDGNHVKICEHFLGFVDIDNSTGAGMTKKILEILQENEISLSNLRGQGYDNGSNMRGKHNGVQSRILTLYPRAFFVPYSSHTLNLVVNDAARCCVEAVTFFDIVQHLYAFFSSSTQRWDILRQNVKGLTLKGLSETSWASRIDALRPMRHQLKEIIQALNSFWDEQINVTSITAARNRSEASALLQKIGSFKFICCLIVWYDILSHINITSKALQESNLNMSQAVSLLSKSIEYLKNYRTNDKFKCVLDDAKKLAIELEIEPEFEQTRIRHHRKIMFDYEHEDEVGTTEKENFSINFFNNILDNAIQSLEDRFELIVKHNDQFQFLYNLNNATKMSDNELRKNCMNLEILLTDGDQKDIFGIDLYEELKYLRNHFEGSYSPTKILQFMCSNNLTASLPNLFVALRILVTLPVSMASAERSFSKMKLIKTYLRSTMKQDRLDGLATLSIEHAIAKYLDLDEIIQRFAAAKAQKVNL